MELLVAHGVSGELEFGGQHDEHWHGIPSLCSQLPAETRAYTSI